MGNFGHDGIASHALVGFDTRLAAKGDVHLTLRYGAPLAAGDMTFTMSAQQAGRLAQGLLFAMEAGSGGKICKLRE
jgi:hypothetical protein